MPLAFRAVCTQRQTLGIKSAFRVFTHGVHTALIFVALKAPSNHGSFQPLRPHLHLAIGMILPSIPNRTNHGKTHVWVPHIPKDSTILPKAAPCGTHGNAGKLPPK